MSHFSFIFVWCTKVFFVIDFDDKEEDDDDDEDKDDLMHCCVGHTAWAPEGRKWRSQAGSKIRQLEVGHNGPQDFYCNHNLWGEPQ